MKVIFFQALISQLLKLCITAMINHKFISFFAVQIYDLSYIYLQVEHVFEPRWGLGCLDLCLGRIENFIFTKREAFHNNPRALEE